MTDASQKGLAESILNSILIGASVSGVRFGALQLLFEPEVAVSGEPYINLSSTWTVFSTRPAAFPENESDIPEGTEVDEVYMATSLRQKVVGSVEVLSVAALGTDLYGQFGPLPQWQE